MKMKSLAAIALVIWINLFAMSEGVGSAKVVCYYGSWAHYRPGNGKVSVSDLNPTLCTHIIYSFVGISEAGEVVILDPWLDIDLGGIRNCVALKKKNPNLKVLVAIGGWNQGGRKFSLVAESPTLRARFVQNVIKFMNTYGLDGFDIDWEYPAGNGGRPQDKQNFVLLLKELRAAFDADHKILTAAVGTTRSRVQESYDVPNLNRYLDFINLMTYDFHGTWDHKTGQNAPLYKSSVDSNADLCVSTVVNQWIQAGASPNKLVLGVGFYGRSFTLADPNKNGVGAPIVGPGNPGPFTREAGALAYYEICTYIKNNGWKVVFDNQQQVPYAYSGNQWVGYDNVQSLERKVDFAKSKGLGGMMVWSLEQDDVRNQCGGGDWPLLRTLNRRLNLISKM